MIDWRPFDLLRTVGEEPRKSLFDRLETTLSRHWITRNGGFLLCGLTALLIAVAVLNAAGV